MPENLLAPIGLKHAKKQSWLITKTKNLKKLVMDYPTKLMVDAKVFSAELSGIARYLLCILEQLPKNEFEIILYTIKFILILLPDWPTST